MGLAQAADLGGNGNTADGSVIFTEVLIDLELQFRRGCTLEDEVMWLILGGHEAC